MPPSTGESVTKIVLTGPENFQLWMPQVVGALSRERVLKIITGAEPAPTRDKDEWETHDKRARGIIIDWIDDRLMLRLESEKFRPLKPETTSKKMFDRLVQMHRDTNVGLTMFYTFIKLMKLQWDGKSSIEAHISRFSTINLKMMSMKKPIDPLFLAMFLLQLLPETPNWEMFKASVINTLPPGADLTFEGLEMCLVGEVLRQKGTAAKNESVLKVAKKEKKMKKRKKKEKEKECELHGPGRHSTDECFTLQQKCEQEQAN